MTMFRGSTSLRRRVGVACVLLATVLCLVYSVATVLIVSAAEKELIEKRLGQDLDSYAARHSTNDAPGFSVGTRLFTSETMPPEIRALDAGFHEINVDGRALHVLVRQINGAVVALVDDQSHFERMESGIFAALPIAFVASLLFALLLSRMTARKVVAPLTALYKAVERGDTEGVVLSLDASEEIALLARAFTEKTRQLNRYLLRERCFTGDVSHELRTPLTAILGAAELLVAEAGNEPALMAAADRVRRNALDAAGRVEALLLLSREPHTMEVVSVNLCDIVDREARRCAPLLDGKQVRLTLEPCTDVHVLARPELVAMAIGNLLRNACQFTETGRIVASTSARTFVLEDTGPGIPDKVRAQLFDRFVRGSDDYVSGSGLGLAIVKRIVDHLGWSLQLTDRTGGGSRFVIAWGDTFTES